MSSVERVANEAGGPNAVIHADENMLDDLMQNNVLFEEDEKPKANEESGTGGVSDEDGEDHDDKLDQTSDISEEEEKSSPQSKEEKEEEEYRSDISEDEGEELKSNVKEEESSEGEMHSPVGEKKPTLASQVVRPVPPNPTQIRKKKSKSYDYATKLNYLFRDARFFMVKSSVAENIDISKDRGVWSTPPANEGRFNKAFRESRNVLMIFSVKESGKFCGFARLASESRRDGVTVPWILPPGLSARALGSVFKVDWINQLDLSFKNVQHLHNPWNENKPIKVGRDGQEIEPSAAEELCRAFNIDNAIDMTPILRKSKESARQQRLRPEHERVRDVPHSRPLAERVRPVTGTNRKRQYNKDPPHYDSGPRPKYNRRSDYNSSPPRSRPPPPPPHYRERQQVSRSYEESVRSNRRFSDRKQDEYDRLPYEHGSNSRSTRPSYERSVDEFIRKNDRHYRRY